MSEKVKRLGDAELEIMLTLWDESEPVTSSHILDRLHGRKDWALSTLMTTLARLSKKGFVFCDRSTRTNYYTALISSEEYRSKEGSSFLERVFGNSLQSLVTHLYDSKSISDKDLADLRKTIDEIERKNADA